MVSKQPCAWHVGGPGPASWGSESEPLGNRAVLELYAAAAMDWFRVEEAVVLTAQGALTQLSDIFSGSHTLARVPETSFVPVQSRAMLLCFHVTAHAAGRPLRLPSPLGARAPEDSQPWRLCYCVLSPEACESCGLGFSACLCSSANRILNTRQ